MIDLKYRGISVKNLRSTIAGKVLNEGQFEAIELHDKIFPFKTNEYVINELIDWNNYENDPIYNLVFPRKELIDNSDYQLLRDAMSGDNNSTIKTLSDDIRTRLNPHPSDQMLNVPSALEGIQHKYEQIILFFPKQGQTCHAYCTFCFRWPQFTGEKKWKFETAETNKVISYLRQNPQITDILFTGGDPMVMNVKSLKKYIQPILDANISSLKNIRIGTKSLSFWPYKYLIGEEGEEIVKLFSEITRRGLHLAFMAHFSHPRELQTDAVKQAVTRIKETGAVIRTQTPLIKKVNDDSSILRDLWQEQVQLGLIPYYLFIARDTGSKFFQAINLYEASNIFRDAFRQLSGLARTVRGPVMSTSSGKVLINGSINMGSEKFFVLEYLQARNPELVKRPFLARFNRDACWFDDLELMPNDFADLNNCQRL
ncbi:MAG: 4Fe-4S cluster-binding domain-containing protein [Cytophagales bacterium]|nr:4Fe-4S cluster-binding domain-containing protein [Cytophagales bacterium]